MQKITVKFGGKVWTDVATNNSGWLAPGAPADLVAALKAAPRSGTTSKGVPIVKDDEGHNLYLGASEFRNEGETLGSGSGSGETKSSKVPQVSLEFAKDVLRFKDQLSKDSVTFLEGVVKAYEEQTSKNIEAAVQALMKLGMSEEKARELAKLQA